jgi:hypothetical protein
MFHRVLSGIAAASGAALTTQFPAFFDQYLQSLGGRLDQARLHAARIQEAARDNGLELAAYLARLAENADPVVRAEAKVAGAALEDAERLAIAYSALTEAAPAIRPLVLAQHLDAAVAQATALRFAPAAPLTAEGLVYAATGALAGFALYLGARRMTRRRRTNTGVSSDVG